MRDFMSVEYGRIFFSDIDKEYDEENSFLGSSVVGIYGPNGSGKTTVVKAVQTFLDAIWIRINDEAYLNSPSISRKKDVGKREKINLVRHGSEYASLSFSFHILYDEIPAHKNITYSFSFRMNPDIDIFDETVVITDSDNGKKTLFSTEKFLASKEYAQSFLKDIVEEGDENENIIKPIELGSIINRKRHKNTFLLYQLIQDIGEDNISTVNGRLLISFQHEMCANLIPIDDIQISNIRGKEGYFLLKYTFSHSTGKILSFWLSGKDGSIIFEPDEDPSTEELEGLASVIDGINYVIDVILKDTHLVISAENGVYYIKIQKANGIVIPYSDESYGVRKIIALTLYLSLLFVKPGMIVVVDELDEGLFEYLIGMILKVIKANARGQLIFTAHNLRPLEILSRDCIRFSIPNESNQKNVKNLYRKLAKTNSKSNLRDVYFRMMTDNNTGSILDEQ